MNSRMEGSIISVLEQIPIVSFYARTRGWPFILSWLHRITGILLIIFVWLHIYSLSFLSSPNIYDAKMQLYNIPIFAFFEWALVIPVIFHALNGGRLILFESFGCRNDNLMIRWMIRLTIIYMMLFSWIWILGNQTVSAFFFWLIMLVLALTLTYGVASKSWSIKQSIYWKLQRISGTFLLVMVPTHLLFMHLNPSIAKEADLVILRMQSFFIKAIDLCLVIGVLYHGGYGIISFVKDFLSPGVLRTCLCSLITVIMLIFAWVGVKLTLFL